MHPVAYCRFNYTVARKKNIMPLPPMKIRAELVNKYNLSHDSPQFYCTYLKFKLFDVTSNKSYCLNLRRNFFKNKLSSENRCLQIMLKHQLEFLDKNDKFYLILEKI